MRSKVQKMKKFWENISQEEVLEGHGFLILFSFLMFLLAFLYWGGSSDAVVPSLKNFLGAAPLAILLLFANYVTSIKLRRWWSSLAYGLMFYEILHQSVLSPVATWTAVGIGILTILFGMPISFLTGMLMGEWLFVFVGMAINGGGIPALYADYRYSAQLVWVWVLVGVLVWYAARKYPEIKHAVKAWYWRGEARKEVVAPPALTPNAAKVTAVEVAEPNEQKKKEKDRTKSQDATKYGEFLRPKGENLKERMRRYSQS